MSYASPPVWKQCPHSETTSEPYKPAFHSGHLSRNTSHGGAATLRIFRLPLFHDGVAPVSVSTLKPPLGVIGVLPLKP